MRGVVLLALLSALACGDRRGVLPAPYMTEAAADADEPPADCPAELTAGTPPPGPCTLGTRCATELGRCECRGYQGGTPPAADTDHAHWECGRSRARADGCPDDIAPGGACDRSGQRCSEVDGFSCGPILRCEDGTWVTTRDTCAEIPAAPR